MPNEIKYLFKELSMSVDKEQFLDGKQNRAWTGECLNGTLCKFLIFQYTGNRSEHYIFTADSDIDMKYVICTVSVNLSLYLKIERDYPLSYIPFYMSPILISSIGSIIYAENSVTNLKKRDGRIKYATNKSSLYEITSST